MSLLLTCAALVASATGDYAWPLSLDPQLTSSFAEYRTGRFHAGIDLRTAGVGREVYAAGAGYVSRVRCSPYGYGKAVYLQLNDGNVAIYAHLSDYYPALTEYVNREQRRTKRYSVDLYLKPSQFPVTKGQLIAKSGQTGIGAPHLHFEMRDAAHEPVNPRLLGYDWPDNVAPKIKEVLIAPQGMEGRVEGDVLPVALPVIRDESGHLRTKPVHAVGKIGVGADVVDPGSGGYNLGVHQLRLLQNGTEIFRMQHDRLSYTNHRNGVVSYHPHMHHEGRFLLTWRWPGNECHSYNRVPDDGWASVGPETRELVVEAVDFYGNATQVTIPIVADIPTPNPPAQGRPVDLRLIGPELLVTAQYGNAPATAPLLQVNGRGDLPFNAVNHTTYRTTFRPTMSGRYTLSVNHSEQPDYQRDVAVFVQGQPTQTIALDDVQITAGPASPYGALFLRAWQVDSPPSHGMPARSKAYKVWPGDAPIFEPITISIPLLPGVAQQRNIHIYRHRGSYWSREDTTFKGGRAEVTTRTPGVYMAMEDTVSPRISNITPSEGYQAQSERPILQASVSDNGSGVVGYQITCGDRWLIAAYDPERNQIAWERDEDLPPGPQTISFIVTDEAGNTEVVQRNIVIPN